MQPPRTPSRGPSLFSSFASREPLSRPEDALYRRLSRWLPEPPGRILVAGEGADPLARHLFAAGHRVTVSAGRLEEEATEAPFNALVVVEALPAEGSLGPFLEGLRRRLEDSGTLVLLEILDLPALGRPEGSFLSTAALEAALGEAGFCLRREQDWPELAGPAAERALAALEAEEDPEGEAGGLRERLLRLQRGEAVYRSLAASREPYRVRAYREGDEARIIDLFAEAFHHHRGPEHWSWQYRANPWGSLKLALAFDEEGSLVAQYAAYPMRFLRSRGGKLETVAAHQVGDTMTRPSVRAVGRGPSSLLGRTARYFFAKFCQGQVAFNYGFNVGNIQRFSMLILKAKRVAPVTFWRRSATAPPLSPPRPWRRWLGLDIRTVREPVELDQGWDRFLHEVAPDYRFLVCRDRDYLRWRYLERPGFEYHLLAAFVRGRLAGWSVFRRQDDRLIWGDGLFRRKAPELAEALLATALASPFAAGVGTIEGWFAPQPAWWEKELLRLGFRTEKEPQDLALMLSPFEAEPTAEELKSELFYTLGDGDLF